MRVPLSWLRDYVQWDLPLPELVERLTTAGLEVAGVEYVGRKPSGELPKLGRREREGPELNWENVYVGELLEVKPHPNADRLVIAVVDYGKGPIESVTGAPNVRVGDKGYKVAVATPGAVLLDPYAEGRKPVEVKPATVRGVRSEVVLCSERELGISEDHTGILILDENTPVGTPLAELLSDVVLEFDLTPNLARCFSIIGVAREVAALTGQRFQTPEVEWHPGKTPIEGQVEVEIKDPELCPRYCAALVRNVRVKRSPFWMRWRLLLAGLRPINNIVDVTNYVMWEWGQPLHAFDYRKLHGREGQDGPPAVIVRRAKSGERIVTLDGVERQLSPEMLLITDPAGPIAIAGVMGGLESEVTEATQDVLIESANFDRVSIRRTSQALKLASEAAARFGRGLPPELTLPALMRAAELIRELAGGEIADGIVDVYPRKQEEIVIEFDPGEVERLLGMALSPEEIVEVLERLEFECHRKGKGRTIQVKVPWHRLDVTIPADLVEEVARVVGYEKIPATLMADPLPPLIRDRERELEEQARDLLVSAGLTEVITYSLTSLEAVAKLDPEGRVPSEEEYLKLANPLTREREYLRKTLLPELLATVRENLKHHERVALFEIGRVYLPLPQGTERPQEPRRLALALAGPRYRLSWHERPEAFDFFDLKGIIEELLRRLRVDDFLIESVRPETKPSWLHPGRAAALFIDQKEVGYFGEVHPQVRENFELPVRVIAGELDLEAILEQAGQVKAYKPLPRFPAVWRDLAIVVDEEIPAERVAQVIEEAGGELLHELVLFDVYRGRPIPQGKKSLAYRLWLLSPERTLTDEEADAVRERIERRLAEELGAELRK